MTRNEIAAAMEGLCHNCGAELLRMDQSMPGGFPRAYHCPRCQERIVLEAANE